MNNLLIIVLSTGVVAGFFGLLIGAVAGARLGREMAETKVIDHANRNPLDYAYEVTDTLYPARKPIMTEIPARQAQQLNAEPRILKKHWGFG